MARFVGTCCAAGMGSIGADAETLQKARMTELMKAKERQAVKARQAAVKAAMNLKPISQVYRHPWFGAAGSCAKDHFGVRFNGKCVKIDGPLSVVEREVEGSKESKTALLWPQGIVRMNGLGTSPAVNPDGSIVPGSGGPAPTPPTKVKRWYVQHNGQDITRGFTSKNGANEAMQRIKRGLEQFKEHQQKMADAAKNLTASRGVLKKDKRFQLPPGIERQGTQAIGRFRITTVIVPGTSQLRIVVEAQDSNTGEPDAAAALMAVGQLLKRKADEAAAKAPEAGPAPVAPPADQEVEAKAVEGLGALGLMPIAPQENWEVMGVFTNQEAARRFAMAASTGLPDATVTEAAEAAAKAINDGIKVTAAEVITALEQGSGGRQLTADQRGTITVAIGNAKPKATTPTEAVTEPDGNGERQVVETKPKTNMMPLLLVGGGIAAFALMK